MDLDKIADAIYNIEEELTYSDIDRYAIEENLQEIKEELNLNDIKR